MNKTSARYPNDQITIVDLFKKLNKQDKINDELKKGTTP
jgi:hypothetical protein